ncbi:hypothetical protein MKX03_019234 [Papaver bracteatum]|nr:hypothetical protein MKX03_019234 [Papaver bracteatum]
MEEYYDLERWEGYVDWRNRPALRGFHGGMLAAFFVLFVEILENLAYLANASNLVLYLLKTMNFLPTRSANTVTDFMGTAFLLALLGGFLSDAASISCEQTSGNKEVMLFVGLYLVALGVGGIKGSLPAHGRKKRSTFFNYFVFCHSCGALIAVTLVVWIENSKGFAWGFGISAITIFPTSRNNEHQTWVFHDSTRITPIFPILITMILAPIYDHLIIPFAGRVTKTEMGISHLQRIGFGLILSIMAMAVAAIVENKRKMIAIQSNLIDSPEALPITFLWVSLQYLFLGSADLFNLAGLLEFFFSEAPASMRSLAMALSWASLAMGFFVNRITASLSNRPWLSGRNLNHNQLGMFYWLMCVC